MDIPVQQFIGKPSRAIYNPATQTTTVTNNLVDVINNSKRSIVKIFELHF
jgi:hypothetical protein